MQTVTPLLIGLATGATFAWLSAMIRRRARGGGPGRAGDWSGFSLLVIVGVLCLWPRAGRAPWGLLPALVAVLAIGAVADRWPVRWYVRGAGLAACAWWLWASGVEITHLKVPFVASLAALGPMPSALITILWVTLCGLAFSISGLVRGATFVVGGLAAATLAVVCLLQPEITGPGALLLAVGIAGTALGHAAVDHRAAPASPGRAGGMALGFLLGAVSIIGALKNTAFLVAVLPMLVIGVPLLDASYAWRLRAGEGAVLGITTRRRRLHEALLEEGYSDRQVFGLYLFGAAFLGALGVGLVILVEVSFLLKLLLLVVALPIGALLGYCAARLLPRRQEQPEGADKVEMFEIPISRVTMEQALDEIERFIDQQTPHHVITSDASALVRAQDDLELRQIMTEADLLTADGAGVVAAARLLGVPLGERVSGCDMVGLICERAARRGHSVYLLGAAPGVAEQAAERLRERCPGLQVVGCEHGYFAPEEEPRILQAIREAAPDVLFVAFGIPKQEKWIKQHMEELQVPVCIGVGGSFDVISGRVKRAPVWMQRAGLEWLYRTVKDPRRLPRLAALPRLARMTFAQLLRGHWVPPKA